MSDTLKNRFAIVNTWPHFKAAEHEAMERIRNAATAIGKECIFVDRFLNKIEEQQPTEMSADEVDFVLNLHFESGKVYDAFSFYALWNPVKFYYDWGYQIYTRNADSHDDFLTCGSPWADDHIVRRIRGDSTRLPARFALYHSLARPILAPKMGGEKSFFYCGINWEKLGKPKGRYHDVLTLLDRTGDLRIYGPREFHGVEPWAGFRSYVGPVAFDGVSMINEIARCGVALVLSSDAHKESELMSARMYESLAGGAIVIADENPFVRRELGDDGLYIDGTRSPERVYEQLRAHLHWIRTNPADAHKLAVRSQEKFLAKYAMDRCLTEIYSGLAERKQLLQFRSLAKTADRKVHILFPVMEIEEKSIRSAISNVRGQSYGNITASLIVDAEAYESGRERIDRLAGKDLRIVARKGFATPDAEGGIVRRRRLGDVLTEYCLANAASGDLVMMVGPAERVFRDHVSRLVRQFENEPDTTCVASDLIIRHFDAKNTEHREIRSGPIDILRPLSGGETLGWGRFLFDSGRVAELKPMLAYLDFAFAVPLLLDAYLGSGIRYTRHASVMNDVQKTSQSMEGIEREEHEIVLDGFRFDLSRITCQMLSEGTEVNAPATLLNPLIKPAFAKRAIEQMDPATQSYLLELLIKSVRQPWIVRLFLKMFYGLNLPK